MIGGVHLRRSTTIISSGGWVSGNLVNKPALNMGLAVALGAALGLLLNNLAIGIAIGIAIGAAWMAYDSRKNSGDRL